MHDDVRTRKTLREPPKLDVATDELANLPSSIAEPALTPAVWADSMSYGVSPTASVLPLVQRLQCGS